MSIGPNAALFVEDDASARQGLYFFKKDEYIDWDLTKEIPTEGYPRGIRDDWPGLLDLHPGKALRGAVHIPAWKKIVFMFDDTDSVALWDITSDRLVEDTSQIGVLFPSTLTEDDGLRSLCYVDEPRGRFVYGFKGTDYTRWTITGDRPITEEDAGYPKKTSLGWPNGLTVAPYCAVSLRWRDRHSALLTHKIYFFLGNDLYLRWDIESNSRNYRLDVPAGWKGWPEFN